MARITGLYKIIGSEYTDNSNNISRILQIIDLMIIYSLMFTNIYYFSFAALDLVELKFFMVGMITSGIYFGYSLTFDLKLVQNS